MSITLSACNNKENEINQQYEDAMSNGKSSVVEEEYNKAIDYFDLALESKKDDKEATNLIKQLKLMLEIEESESHGAYFYQMERIDKINEIDTESDVVKKKAYVINVGLRYIQQLRILRMMELLFIKMEV